MKNNIISFEELGRKKIRCMMYEGKQGEITVEYDNFETFKEKYENVIEVYNPDKKQKKMILDIISSNLKVEKEGFTTEIPDEEFLLVLIEELSNIKLELDKEKDKELIQSILDDPSDLLLRVKLEIDKLCNSIFYMWYDTVKELSKTPEELKNALILTKENEVKEEVNQEELEKQNKIQELEEQLKLIKGE